MICYFPTPANACYLAFVVGRVYSVPALLRHPPAGLSDGLLLPHSLPFGLVSRSPVSSDTHSRECQKEDWSTHKLCCGKTYEEVCIGKEALEERILAEVAAAAAAAAPPQSPMTFFLTPFSAAGGTPSG